MKGWVTFVLWAIGLVVVLSWVWRKMNPPPLRPPTFSTQQEPIIKVDIEDSGVMEGLHFDTSNPSKNNAYTNWWTFDPRELTR